MHSELIDEVLKYVRKIILWFYKKTYRRKTFGFSKKLKTRCNYFKTTNVYGPFSGAWTIGPCNKLINGKVVFN